MKKRIITTFVFTLMIFFIVNAQEVQLKVQTGLGNYALFNDISSDDKFIISASYEKLKLYDVKTGTEIISYNTADCAYIQTLKFCYSGRYFISVGMDKARKKTYYIWKIDSANYIKKISIDHEFTDVSFSADDKTITYLANNTIITRMFFSGRIVEKHPLPSKELKLVAYNRQSKQAAYSKSDTTVVVYNLAKNKIINVSHHKSKHVRLIFSNDGNYLARISYETIFLGRKDGKKKKWLKWKLKVWELSTNKLIFEDTNKNGSFKFAFKPDNKQFAFLRYHGSKKTFELFVYSLQGELLASKNKYYNSDLKYTSNGKYLYGGTIGSAFFLYDMYGTIVRDFGVNIDVIDNSILSEDSLIINYYHYPNKIFDIHFLSFLSETKGLDSISIFDKNKQTVKIDSGEINISFKKSIITILNTAENFSYKYKLVNTYHKAYFDFDYENKFLIYGDDSGVIRKIDLFTGKLIKELKLGLNNDVSLMLSPDKRYLWVHSQNDMYLLNSISLDVIERFSGQMFSGHSYSVSKYACFNNKSNKVSFIGSDEALYTYNITEGKNKKIAELGQFLWSIHYSQDNKYLTITFDPGVISILDADSGQELVRFFSIKTYTSEPIWLVYTPDGYWAGTKNCSKHLTMVKGLNVWRIDQFAVKNNRPDIILQRLGSTDTKLIEHFNKQYSKRLRKLGLTESQLEQGYHTPDAKIIKSSKSDKFVNIEMKFSDSKYNLSTCNIYVNDVPLYGKGMSIAGKSKKITEKVELTNGVNKIEISCYNEKATESFREAVYYNYNKKVKPNLYFIGFGVSTYKNPILNLQYAHQDALDLEKTFLSMKGKGFGNVYTKVLVNEQVTTENIKATKEFLKNARPDDVFVLFIAGHGVHDKDADATYYYLTYDTDINNLSGTAANFEFIENLLQGIEPRNKLFLMDACESGESYEEETSYFISEAQNRGLKSRGFVKVDGSNNNSQSNRIIVIQKNRYIYNDLLRRSGAIVFSSSRGSEYSYEFDELRNGLFTEFIIKALTTIEADIDNNGIISTDELRSYVSKKVGDYSGGAQNPTVDRDNIYQKFGFNIK